jgi:hypothetical protein
MKLKNNITFFITHSFGELDVITPIIAKLKKNTSSHFTIVFCVESIYDRFKNNDHQQKISQILEINIIFLRLPNKFDFPVQKNMNLIRRVIRKFKSLKLSPIGLINLIRIVKKSSILLHEHSCQYSSVKWIYMLSSFFNKKTLVYIHGHATNIHTKINKVKFCPNRSILLCFHSHSTEAYRRAGYNNQSIIGYPKFYNEWSELIIENFSANPFNKDYAVIFSRPVHPFYMDQEIYERLLIDSCESITNKFSSDFLIIIKIHPRENPDFIDEILQNKNIFNYKVSTIDSSILSVNAKFIISFWTSAILSAVALKTPSLEYYVESKAFRDIEPEGSAYKEIGIKSVSDKFGVMSFIDSVLDNTYIQPSLNSIIEAESNLSIFE